ncbi:cache domain-containing protein [Pseudomonas sp. NPDC007930]|uniref:cache domain-containing protein n=1 Tax=Pseudomonas sp. NPDC007930 TaxID=3364417 RepID=UPI0036E0B622
MPRAARRTLPLHICVSVMFTALMLAVGAFMGYYNYRQASHIILANSAQVFDGIEHDVQLDLATTFEPVERLLGLLALNPAVAGGTLQQRLALLPSLAQALRTTPRLASLYVGYGNGDFFMVRALRSDAQRAALGAPSAASLQVWSIEQNGQRSRSLFFDPALAPLGDGPPPGRFYDPRERPWYQAAQAKPGVAGTDPYVFYSDRRVGTTLALDAGAGTVLGADITLDELSATLARHRVTASTQLALYDRLGHAVAYPDAARLVVERGTAELEQVSKLHPALALFMAQPGQSRLTLGADDWIATSQALPQGGPSGLRLALLVPERELLAQAYRLRWEGALITLAALLLCLPLGWLSARLLASPLRQLAREVNTLADSHNRPAPLPPSVVLEVHQVQQAVAGLGERLATQAAARQRIAGQAPALRLQQWLEEACAATQARAAVLYQGQGNALHAIACQADGHARSPLLLGLQALPARGPWPAWVAYRGGDEVGVASLGFEQAQDLQPLLLALQCPRVNVLSLALGDGLLVLLRADQGEPLEAAGSEPLRQLAALAPLLA